jgi:hypothetical protein
MCRMKVLASAQKREASRAGPAAADVGPAAGAAADPHPQSIRRPAPAAAAAMAG